MRQKKPSLIIAFGQTTQAMAAEKHFEACSLPGRLIPVPAQIEAGCGLAWKAAPDAGGVLTAALDAAGIAYDAVHIIEI